MTDLRYRTFRMKVYAHLWPSDLGREERERFGKLLDNLDEDGIVTTGKPWSPEDLEADDRE